jgi:hypothetical protein
MPVYELQWDLWGQPQSVDNGDSARYYLHFNQPSKTWLLSKQLMNAALVVMKLHSNSLISITGGAVWRSISSPLPEARTVCVNETLTRPLANMPVSRVFQQTEHTVGQLVALVKHKYNMSDRLFHEWQKATLQLEEHNLVSPSKAQRISATTGETMIAALSEAKLSGAHSPCPAYFVSGVWKPGYKSRLMGYYVLNDYSPTNPTYQLRWDVWGQAQEPKHRRQRSRMYFLRRHHPSKSWCITSGFAELAAQRLEMLQIPAQIDVIFGKQTAVNATNTRWLSLQNGMLTDVTAVCETHALTDPFPLLIPTPSPTAVFSSVSDHLLARIAQKQKQKLPEWELKNKFVYETTVHHLNELHLSQLHAEETWMKDALEGAFWSARQDFHDPCPSFLVYQTNRHMHRLKLTHTPLQHHLEDLQGYYVLEFWDSSRKLPVYRLQRDTWGQRRRTRLGEDGHDLGEDRTADYYLYLDPSRNAWCIGVAGVQNATAPSRWLLTAFGDEFDPAFHGYDEAAGVQKKLNGLRAELMLVQQAKSQWLAAGEVVLTMDAFCNVHVITQEPGLAAARLIAPELQAAKQAPATTRPPTFSVPPSVWDQFQDRTEGFSLLNQLEDQVQHPVLSQSSAALLKAEPRLRDILTVPTPRATAAPTKTPTTSPTSRPTTGYPTATPTKNKLRIDGNAELLQVEKQFGLLRTEKPTPAPSYSPTSIPSFTPTPVPTSQPTSAAPTFNPTLQPTAESMLQAAERKIKAAEKKMNIAEEQKDEKKMSHLLENILSNKEFTSLAPTATPSIGPTSAPTAVPSVLPTANPTALPTYSPTNTLAPSDSPSSLPTRHPTGHYATYADLQESQELAAAIRKARLAQTEGSPTGSGE